MHKLTHERLIAVADYDPTTGRFTAKINRNRVKAGTILGTRHGNGYLVARIDGERFLLHRLAYFYMKGTWPKDEIDHRNLRKDENRFANLREATRQLNAANIGPQRNNPLGRKGVYVQNRKKRYRAQIKVDNRTIYLGSFKHSETASVFYALAAMRHFGDFARVA